MSIEYRWMTADAIDLLVSTRIEVLRAANRLPDDTDMTEVGAQSRRYYESALRDGSHAALLAFDGDAFVGAGSVSYYRVMPTYHNPAGEKAYIMNMYVRPAYRRRGIATRMLELLVSDARRRGVAQISLEATEAGRPLYQRFGFVPMEHEMELPEQSAVAATLGRTVTVTIDRPLGSRHPDHPDLIYPVNYGYVRGVPAPDGEDQDAYVLGVDAPVQRFTGRVAAVIRRADDVEDKWVVCPENVRFSAKEIMEQVRFQERYFESSVITEGD